VVGKEGVEALVHPTPITPATWVTKDDKLVILSLNSLSGQYVIWRARVLTPQGEIMPFEGRHTPNTDRTLALTTYPLTEGYLLHVVAFAGTATKRGQTFIGIGLLRGTEVATNRIAILAKGYISSEVTLTYPEVIFEPPLTGRGVLRSIRGTNPAAGSVVSETVPTNARWTLHALQVSLTTDATITDRRMALRIDDGTNELMVIVSPQTQGASLTYTYNFAPVGIEHTLRWGNVLIPIPANLTLLQGWRIRLWPDNLQAGDNLTAPQMLVEEWIEV